MVDVLYDRYCGLDKISLGVRRPVIYKSKEYRNRLTPCHTSKSKLKQNTFYTLSANFAFGNYFGPPTVIRVNLFGQSSTRRVMLWNCDIEKVFLNISAKMVKKKPSAVGMNNR